ATAMNCSSIASGWADGLNAIPTKDRTARARSRRRAWTAGAPGARAPRLPAVLLHDVAPAAHLDPARRRFGPLRNHDFQYAMLAAGGDAVGIGAVGQGEAAMEDAVAALHPRV